MTPQSKIAQKQKSLGKSASSGIVEVLDVMAVTANNPSQAVKSFENKKPTTKIDCDILIVGGGTGGVAAALQASQSGFKVCLTEETDWLGGQMTAQGVSALDENALVETSGSTLKYQQMRTLIRAHYTDQFQLSPTGKSARYFNPGNCWVSRLSFEPSVAKTVLDRLLAPAVSSGSLSIYYRTKAVSAKIQKNAIRVVRSVNLETGQFIEFHPKICLDATELGDLLPLVGAEYRAGADSQLETLEPHASLAADPENLQDFVYPFAIEFRKGENHTIDKPPFYEQFNQKGLFTFYGYKMFDNSKLTDKDGKARPIKPFWTYRRLLDRKNWINPPSDYDLAMINWMANDLRGENIVDKPPAVAAERLALGKALSLGFLYWLQTEAPRDRGGVGYPELMLRPEVMGTTDGLSKYPYIRESRRVKALSTIAETDIAAATNSGARAKSVNDSVTIGHYPIDIHGDEEKPDAAQATRPFQLPLTALLPSSPTNLITSAKNIGTTHITNGAYRLHPIEWSIGEAAGALAFFSLEQKKSPHKVATDGRLLRQFQSILCGLGVPLYWYDDVPVWSKSFPAIQALSVAGVLTGVPENLQFRPAAPITRAELCQALAVYLKLSLPRKPADLPPDVGPESRQAAAIEACLRQKLAKTSADGDFQPEAPVVWSDLEPVSRHKWIKLPLAGPGSAVVTRAEFARWLYESPHLHDRLGRL